MPEPRGGAKADAVRAYFSRSAIDWPQSCAYTDEREDLPLLALVGEPVFVTSLRSRPNWLPANMRLEDWDSV